MVLSLPLIQSLNIVQLAYVSLGYNDRTWYVVVADLSAYLSHVVSLGYSDRPDYQHCRGLFVNALRSVGAKPTDKLVFTQPSAAASAPPVMIYQVVFLNIVII